MKPPYIYAFMAFEAIMILLIVFNVVNMAHDTHIMCIRQSLDGACK